MPYSMRLRPNFANLMFGKDKNSEQIDKNLFFFFKNMSFETQVFCEQVSITDDLQKVYIFTKAPMVYGIFM